MEYKKAVELIVEKRKNALFTAEQIFHEALNKNKDLYDTEIKLRGLTLKICKGESVDNNEIKVLEDNKAKLLKSMGITQDSLTPPPSCKNCRDTGLTENGKFCACVKTLALSGEDNIKIPLHDFSEADFSLFDKEQFEYHKNVFSSIQTIAEQFPNNKKRNIVLNGLTGTGKTFLAGCAASTMLSRGFSVTAVTAFDFVNRCLAYHTTFDNSKLSHLRPLLDSSLLIIDDLGTESILKNITLEYMFTIINERQLDDKLTIITTNLSKEAILARYNERIYSRLFNSELSYHREIYSADRRLK